MWDELELVHWCWLRGTMLHCKNLIQWPAFPHHDPSLRTHNSLLPRIKQNIKLQPTFQDYTIIFYTITTLKHSITKSRFRYVLTECVLSKFKLQPTFQDYTIIFYTITTLKHAITKSRFRYVLTEPS